MTGVGSGLLTRFAPKMQTVRVCPIRRYAIITGSQLRVPDAWKGRRA